MDRFADLHRFDDGFDDEPTIDESTPDGVDPYTSRVPECFVDDEGRLALSVKENFRVRSVAKALEALRRSNVERPSDRPIAFRPKFIDEYL